MQLVITLYYILFRTRDFNSNQDVSEHETDSVLCCGAILIRFLKVERFSENITGVMCSASKSSIRGFVITEKAPTRAFSWSKAATTTS